jgi:hypothetical protein
MLFIQYESNMSIHKNGDILILFSFASALNTPQPKAPKDPPP